MGSFEAISTLAITATIGVAGLIGVLALTSRLLEIGGPDEWVLQVRNGRLIRAGVGIVLIRRPGDTVARFTATVQRVRFNAEALTREHLPVSIQGFVLWAVSPANDDPFTAYSNLGLVNLADYATRRRIIGHERKHLLSRPQHRAFQQLLAALTQQQVGSLPLDALLVEQDDFVGALRQRIEAATATLGIRVHGLQISEARPSDPEVLQRLAAESTETIRQQAAQTTTETDERIAQKRIASDAVLARQKAEADQAQSQRAEQADAELSELRLAREAREHEARLARKRNDLEAEKERIEALAAAEQRKPQAVRDYELARLGIERLPEIARALSPEKGSWITVSGDSPLSGLLGLAGAARQLFVPPSEETKPN